MKIGALHSHLNGHEWLLVHQPQVWEEIESTIAAIDAGALKTKISKEEKMVGRKLFSPKALNLAFSEHLGGLGWSESRTSYYVTDDPTLTRKILDLPAEQQKQRIEAAGCTPHFSYNQTDFVKHRVAIEVQFGKYSFIAYDLFVKHLAFYVANVIDVGIESPDLLTSGGGDPRRSVVSEDRPSRH